jgi:two-component system LytT family response regulator
VSTSAATDARTQLRAVIVDDEEPARELLRVLLAAWPEVVIVAESGEGTTALEAIRTARADLVFLDVQMPGRSGIEVAMDLIESGSPPLIVFVTAYDQYAIKAFELSACDYLLKPFDAERLGATIDRVRARRCLPPEAMLVALRALVATVHASRPDAVVLKVDGRHLFLDPDEIEWIEAVGKEVRVHSQRGALTVRETMNNLEERLDGSTFLRVQRSAIVNRRHIAEVQPWFKGDYVLILRRGARVVSGRTYRDVVQRLVAPSGR